MKSAANVRQQLRRLDVKAAVKKVPLTPFPNRLRDGVLKVALFMWNRDSGAVAQQQRHFATPEGGIAFPPICPGFRACHIPRLRTTSAHLKWASGYGFVEALGRGLLPGVSFSLSSFRRRFDLCRDHRPMPG
jgi:hypothetical protein